MMKVFICPQCGSITTVSRRKKVMCCRCEGVCMISSKLTFKKYSEMDETQRMNYAESWIYIRNRSIGDQKEKE